MTTPPQHTHWLSLVDVPLLGVGILSTDGTVRFASAQLTSMMLGEPDPQRTVGRNIRDLLPPAAAEDRLRILRSLKSPDQVAILRSFWRGRAIRTSYRLIAGAHSEPPLDRRDVLVLAQFEPAGVDPPADAAVFDASSVDLGPFDVLSDRELEVFALLGEGLSIEQIAKRLHRSPHTIRHHREAIAEKLGEPSRARLTRMAAQAGLRPEHAGRPREKPSYEPD